jgi:hypothetical protein
MASAIEINSLIKNSAGRSSLWHPHPKIYGICIFNNKHINLLILIINGYGQGKGSGNYTIFGWGCHKELFPIFWKKLLGFP